MRHAVTATTDAPEMFGVLTITAEGVDVSARDVLAAIGIECALRKLGTRWRLCVNRSSYQDAFNALRDAGFKPTIY